ncbi:sensor histidine kinase [Streptomyces sp. NPDC056149]|uniref:sensor histidine kinase n=1 Tax=Streptomyces sp. NPDC056149 TaxID=3345728 RepID=UPI0035DC0E1E
MAADLWALVQRRVGYLLGAGRCSDLVQDVTLALLVGLTSVVLLTSSHDTGFTHSYLLSALCAMAAAASLLWRRNRPELCVAVAALATFASDEATALIAASYAVGLYGRGARALVTGGGALAYVVARLLTGEVISDPVWGTYMVVLYTVLPAFYGRMVRRQRELKEQLQEQLSHAEAATEHAARFVMLEKRTRLAFEIHDTVGHHATLLVLRASTAERQPDLPPQATKAFQDIQDGAITVMQELRRVITVLRDEDGQADEETCAYASCHEFLEALARNMRAVGIQAAYSVEGTVRPLDAGTESRLYRVSREALTNAAKHAPGAPVRIGLAFAPRSVTLTVHNGRPVQRLKPVGGSGGLGLHSMRSVVEMGGGTFRAGPAADGGYRIEAVMALPPDSRSTEREHNS